jgi:Flp pilus assembly protein TadG
LVELDMCGIGRRRARRDEGGAAAVEFALIAGVVLIPLLLGLIQFGWYFYISSTTSHAASSVARRLEVGDCWSGSDAADYVAAQVPTSTTFSKTPSDLTGATVGTTQIQVTVTADADILGFFPMPNGGTVTRTVDAQLEDSVQGAACS